MFDCISGLYFLECLLESLNTQRDISDNFKIDSLRGNLKSYPQDICILR